MAVALNICVAWPSSVASIPAGWTREIGLDSRYILGAATGADTDLVTDRGNTTHTHTSPPHAPIQDAHGHAVSTTTGPDTTLIGGNTVLTADGTHQHLNGTSSTDVATNNDVAITVDATTNDLAFLSVIWIKSDGNPNNLPSGSIAFFSTDVLPAGWSRVNGDGYLKGAAGGSGGGSSGGTNTHGHTSPPHTHTQNLHDHTATSPAANTAVGKGTGAQVVSSLLHTHALSVVATTATNQAVPTTINTDSHEPPFYKVNVIQASVDSFPSGIIALWLGQDSNIPTGWSRFTALDGKWAKACSGAGQVGTTGGGLQHNHTATNCQPVQNAHSHSITDAGAAGTTTSDSTGSNQLSADLHKHTWSTSGVVATNQSTTVTIDLCTSGAALPKHRTAIFVQFGSPGPVAGVYTSYNYLWAFEQIEGGPPPEVTAAIARGDRRYMRPEES